VTLGGNEEKGGGVWRLTDVNKGSWWDLMWLGNSRSEFTIILHNINEIYQ
jgi:hypothetical protein